MTKGNMQIRVVTMAVAVALVFVVLGCRLWYLQVLSSENYTDTAQETQKKTVPIPAQRGVIYDREGEILANNVPGLNVTLIPDYMQRAEDGRERVKELAEVLDADVEEVLAQYDAALDPETGNRYGAMLIKENADKDDITYISERTERFPGVAVNEDWVRSYPEGSLAAHVLGYTGAVTQDELETESFKDLSNDSVVGKSGVELRYEEELRGDPGRHEYTIDALGRVVTVRRADGTRADGQPEVAPELGQPDSIEQPQPGNDLALTIDMDLQKVAERELEAAMARAQAEGTTGEGGAVVAMDPDNGEILAMASRPNFDPQLFVGGIAGEEEVEMFEYLNDSELSNDPFMNRAITGGYPGASTFKVFTGLAGFSYGVIDAYTTYTDEGGCWLPDGVEMGCWLSWIQSSSGMGASHGTQNFAEAVMDSNDKFFYEVTDRLYQQTDDPNLLPKYYKKFGFGSLTGVDLALESEGRVPTKEWFEWYKKETLGYVDRPWGIGDWVNLSIGQGDVLVTPIQMAQAYAAIQNGGTLVTPHVGKSVKSQDGEVIEEILPEPEGTVEFDATARAELLRGFRLVTAEGTAAPAYKNSKLDIIGKSGTGERYGKDPVNWFAGWAEGVEDPIVVVVMVEGGEHSEVTAAPAVRKVIEAHHGVEGADAPSDASIVAAYANSGVQ
jgi:penicillin-binding protein 2